MKKKCIKGLFAFLLTLVVLSGSLLSLGSFSVSADEAGNKCGETGCSGAYVNGICTLNGTHYEKATITADGYYEIGNAGQLYWFARSVNTGNSYADAILTADIDLENKIWYPIGVYEDVFDSSGATVIAQYFGTFDGQGHTVSNFIAEGGGSQGLIGYSGVFAEVKNVGVVNATVSGWNAGAVMAYEGTVKNCYAMNCTVTAYSLKTSGKVYAGAVAGSQTATVINCYAYDCMVNYGAGMEERAKLTPVGGKTPSNSYYYGIITNVTSLSVRAGEVEKTKAQFMSGEVAYLLGDAWGQTLSGDNRDAYPVFATSNNKIYCRYDSCADDAVGNYSNDSTTAAPKPQHVSEKDDGDCTTAVKCKNCDYVFVDAKKVHSYDLYDCTDATCNNKGCTAVRDANPAHSYTDCDDTTCNNKNCSVKRKAVAHFYEFCTDIVCANCPKTRVPGEHTYDNACDSECNSCAMTREVGDHKDENGDKLCDECKADISENDGLPMIAVIGIVAGAVVVVGAVCVAVYLLVIRKRKGKSA